MKIKITVLFLTVALLIGVILSCGVTFAAPSDGVEVDDLILGVGADESERTLNWYSSSLATGVVAVAPAGKLVDGEFPQDAEYFSVSATSAVFRPGYYIKRATITGLKPETNYAYAIIEGSDMSEIYYFSTSAKDEFTFAFVGDPQISQSSHGTSWADTVEKIKNQFGAELIVSAGDQISTPDSIEHFDYFAVDGLSSVTFAPTAGPVHDVEGGDTYGAYTEHYNIPNLSDEYGVNGGTSNYYYVYNNILFMNLNMCDASASTNGEHRSFMEEAIAANPDVKWRIVVMHNSLFSTGMHGDPSYQWYESEIGKFRPALAPVFTELGIDVVLSGHDHVYLRTYMMDGVEISDTDTVISGTVSDPDGTLYVCASSSTGSKFYDKTYEPDFASCENYEKRKSAIKFEVTPTTLKMTSYFLDEMVDFDSFAISKEHLTCELIKRDATPVGCETDGTREYYYCKCGKAYEDAEGTVFIGNVKEWATIPHSGHDFAPATCTEPKTCKNCGETEGKKLGHSWQSATCTTPQTCWYCDATRGNPLPHNSNEATCSEAPTCKNCGAVTGDPLPHTPTEPSCNDGSRCLECGERLSESLGHNLTDPTCTEGSSCTRCGIVANNALGHSYDDDDDAECNRCSHQRTVAQNNSPDTTPDDGEDNTALIIVIVASSLAIVGGIAAFILFKKKKR